MRTYRQQVITILQFYVVCCNSVEAGWKIILSEGTVLRHISKIWRGKEVLSPFADSDLCEYVVIECHCDYIAELSDAQIFVSEISQSEHVRI